MLKITSTLHNHTTFCDGKATLDELVAAAISEGVRDLGISRHTEYGMLKNGEMGFDPHAVWDEAKYIAAVRECARKNASDICIWCGVEQDFYAPSRNRDAYDYIIGSVHYIRDDASETYYAIDSTPEEFELCLNTVFHGDIDAMIRRYFETVMENVRIYHPNIIGHFDLIKKCNTNNRYFDEESESYIGTALHALNVCADSGSVFELNMARRRYPAPFLLRELAKRDSPVTLSADCHSKENLCGSFDEGLTILRDCGFKHIHVWKNGEFVKKAI